MSTLLQRIIGNPAPTGHNNPPSDMEILQERINENNQKLMDKVEQLLVASESLPKFIDNDNDAGIVTDHIKELTGTIKSLESTRVAEKEPYLALTRAVDGFFKVPMGKLDAAKLKANTPLNDYLVRQAAAERIRRENEAKALREKAQQEADAAAALEKTNPVAANISMVNAGVTEQQAAHVETTVNAKASELASSRGFSGGLAALRTRWVGEIKNRQELDLNVLRPYFTEEALQKAINAAVSAGVREVKGAQIYQKTDTVVR